MQQAYYSALARAMMITGGNDPQSRKLVYDLARRALQRQVGWENDGSSDAGGSERLTALEGAIQRIEADVVRGAWRQLGHGAANRTALPKGAIEILPPPRFEISASRLQGQIKKRNSIRSLLQRRPAIPLVGVAILGVVVCAIFLHKAGKAVQREASSQEVDASRNTSIASLGLPAPSSFGVYAVVNGRLATLEPLPIRAPDAQLAVSSAISSASKTKLPNGNTQFIAYGRDLVDGVPEKVFVRVVAHIRDKLRPGEKKESGPNGVNDTWAVRNISYRMKVAPVDGNPAMVLIRPAAADFSFPAGRYALILKGAAFDFSVDGPAADFTQCIERVVNEFHTISYTDCPRP